MNNVNQEETELDRILKEASSFGQDPFGQPIVEKKRPEPPVQKLETAEKPKGADRTGESPWNSSS